MKLEQAIQKISEDNTLFLYYGDLDHNNTFYLRNGVLKECITHKDVAITLKWVTRDDLEVTHF